MKNFVMLTVFAIVVAVVVVFISEQNEEPMRIDTVTEKGRKYEGAPLTFTSPAFGEGESIPMEFTCEGNNISPELSFDAVPEGTKSLALTMYDPDVPVAVREEGFFDHWVLFNIPATATGIPEGGTLGTSGKNTRGALAYTGPCPPSEYEPSEHRYIFTLYALDTELVLSEGASRAQVEEVVEGHVLGVGTLMGRYKKQRP